MSASTVRAVALAVFFLAGIPGMIISSINDNNGAAVTFGLVAAVAAVVLVAVTAVSTGRLAPDDGYGDAEAAAGQRGGAALEDRIAALVAAGADEAEVRALVGDAIRFGRHR